MRIECIVCHKYLGEIRDATLRKDIAYLCKDCNPTNRNEAEDKFNNDYFCNYLMNEVFKTK